MQNEAVRTGVALRIDLAADVPPVLGDRVQLQQVILNLVMNGIEAMNTVADRPREMVIRSSAQESDNVLLAVQDSGIGIDPRNLDKIFDTFYTTKPQGMGMGLAISRSIVENHGGKLWAVPNDGPGATFQFTILKEDEDVLYPRPLTKYSNDRRRRKACRYVGDFVQYQLTPRRSITITTRWTPAIISLRLAARR